MSIDDFIISIFCLVDDELSALLQNQPIRQRGFVPMLADSEVITMEIIGEFLGHESDKRVWDYFSSH